MVIIETISIAIANRPLKESLDSTSPENIAAGGSWFVTVSYMTYPIDAISAPNPIAAYSVFEPLSFLAMLIIGSSIPIVPSIAIRMIGVEVISIMPYHLDEQNQDQK